MKPAPGPSTTLASALLLPAALYMAACGDLPAPVEPEAPQEIALSAAEAQAAQVGADDWIVVFRSDVADPPGLARALVAQHGGSLRFTYEHALKGFAATLPPQALNGIRSNPHVDYVEADGVMTADGSGTDPTPGSWGLDRVDERSLAMDGVYDWAYDGTGVHAYILDTGIWPTHVDFGGRATAHASADFIGDGRAGVDNCNGHGTHVAGTIGGLEYGVAKNVMLHGVRVLGCSGSGSYSGVIAGINWVVANRVDPAVANMSLSGGVSTSVNDAVNNAVASGVVFAVSAGNDNRDACTKSPASAADALTIGSTTSSDARSSFSNYGNCVDIFAPGSAIKSTFNTSNTATATYSGTSMSSPHVAGAAALYRDANPAALPPAVASAIIGTATVGAISNPGSGSPNLLLCALFDGCKESGSPPSNETVWVKSVSGVTLTGGKHKSGMATVTVEASDGSMASVAVVGDWFKNGGTSPARSANGTTNSGGTADIDTGGEIKGASSLRFCVTSLAKSGYSDATDYANDPVCSSGGGSDPGDPPDGPADPPDDLTATATTNRGGKTKVSLSWTAWTSASTVDVWRDSGSGAVVIATISNSGSYTDNKGGASDTYRVCEAGVAPSDGTCNDPPGGP